MSGDDSPLLCRDDAARREQARRAGRNGFDYVEVDCEQTTLTVHCLDRVPAWITPAHLRIEGGRRIRNLRVTQVSVVPSEDEDLDDCLLVGVDRPGDFCTYRLCISELDAAGHPTGRPPAEFDPRYACVSFSFKAGCPSDLDCAAEAACEAPVRDEPVIDYLAKDYASLRRLLLDRLSLLMPGWRERHVPDLGLTLVELLAHVGDTLSYYQDAVATEAYLHTARRRISVRRHARLVDYLLHEGCNARTWLAFEVQVEALDLLPDDFYAITAHPRRGDPVLREQDLPPAATAAPVAFQPCLPPGRKQLTLRQARNRISLYTWDGTHCCLARGSTTATLVDPGRIPAAPPRKDVHASASAAAPAADVEAGVAQGRWHQLHLQPCEVLLFEEVLGPRTGQEADADPGHRHAVRLTRAEPSYDPVTRQLLWEVEWCAEDALPFPLCLSSRSSAPLCRELHDVSVAWGNVVLADHGLDVRDEPCSVPEGESVARCDEPCRAAETGHRPGRWHWSLAQPEPTFAVPPPACTLPAAPQACGGCGTVAASAALVQDVLQALPQVGLQSTLPGDDLAHRWQPRPDLLDSGPDDRHFVVEVDDERRAWLRFGDGTCGRAPAAGETFTARYRVGNGTAGNVGADTLVQLVFRNALPQGAGLRVRNPMAASGGQAAEDVAEARLRAPDIFRRRLERAVTADDYAALAMRDFPHAVQRAAAVVRASGARVEVQVAVDAVGQAEPDPALLRCIEASLQGRRRIGHDVRVLPARRVPIALGLHVCVKTGYLRAHVKAALLERLGRGTWHAAQAGAPALGLFHPDALRLGEPVSASRIVAAAQAVDGVAGVVLERLERLFDGPDGELDSGVLAIGPLEVASLDNDPAYPENGILTLVLEGGR